MPEAEKDLGPATPGLAHERQAAAAKVVRDVLAGTLHLRALREEYLPAFQKESDGLYNARLAVSVLFNATKRTLGAFSGMVFRRDPRQSDIPPAIVEHFGNIDLTGRDLATFAKDHFEDAEADGHAGIFVDMQPPVDASDRAEERAAGNRPYWVNLRKQDILAFGTANVGGVTVLTELRYRETVTRKAEGGWSETEVHRVRQYWLGSDPNDTSETPAARVLFRVWELDPEKEWPGEDAEDWNVVVGKDAPGVMAIGRIPLAVSYTGRTGYLESDPPLMDLALENVKHYQTDSDNQNLAHTAKIQTLVITGEPRDSISTVSIGPGWTLVLENPEASAGWIGADGSSFGVFLEDLNRIELRMAKLGLSMLATDQRANMSEGSKRIDKGESDSHLGGSAKGLEAGLNEALALHAEWLDTEEYGAIGVNMDFETEPLDSAMFGELRALWAERGISWETLVEVLDAGEMMPPGWTKELERQRLADEVGAALDREQEALFGSEQVDEEDEEGEDEEDEEPPEPVEDAG